ncbi:MAG TPA: signal peptidase I [Pyrinomonadaceae bacterium]|jgi:signal peptidase I|nr:signal peptidase I [Pyrinomonadaceae bacterium]
MNSKVIVFLITCCLISGCELLTQRTITFQDTSMLPTIKNGDRLKVRRLDAKARAQLSRGDIVVFRYPLDPSKSYIKRLIGLPGDQIEIKRGEVWVNGVKLTEPYLSSRLNVSQRPQQLLTVPAHAYFMMGDNRDNSSDSRMWGAVPEELLDAKVVSQ